METIVHGVGGWDGGGEGPLCPPGSLLSSICFTIGNCTEGELLELEVVSHFTPKTPVNLGVVGCVKVLSLKGV